MNNYALVRDGKVVNVIVWDGIEPYETDGQLVLLNGPGGIGWDYQDGTFVDNRPQDENEEG
jgi:hypothetical protein